MNRRFAIGVAALGMFLAAAGCSSREGTGKPKTTPAAKPAVSVDAAKAETGDVTDGIEVVGTLSPKFQAEIKPEYGGLVAQVYVNDWARVRKGDPLLRVDTREGMDDARTQKEEAAARIAAAKAQVAAAREDVKHVETRLSKAMVRSPFEGIVAERAEKGYEYGVKTRLDVDDAQLNRTRALGNLARARRDYLVAGAALRRAMGTLGDEIETPAGIVFEVLGGRPAVP